MKANNHPYGGKWRPSIHMPKACARIWLRVKSIRADRLHDISDADIIAEGIDPHASTLRGYFCNLWSLINGTDSWNANPFVWVVRFELMSTDGKRPDLKVKDHPILFSEKMVRAILDGRKTQTRRVINPQPEPSVFAVTGGDAPGYWNFVSKKNAWYAMTDGLLRQNLVDSQECRFGQPGDLLWVRETWDAPGAFGEYGRKIYRADFMNNQ